MSAAAKKAERATCYACGENAVGLRDRRPEGGAVCGACARHAEPGVVARVVLPEGYENCDTLASASRLVCEERDASGVGSSEWYSYAGVGDVLDRAGLVVAHVSYNGRVWLDGKLLCEASS